MTFAFSRFVTRFLLLLAGLCLTASTAVAGFSTTPGSTAGLPAPAAASRSVVGDFNNDGRMDVLYQTGVNGTAWGYSQGNTNGTFTTTTAAGLPGTPFAGVTQFDFTGTGAILIAGDFNGDGRTDIWFTVNGSAGTILWNGAAGFTSASGSSFNFPAVAATPRLVAGDFNVDGITDFFYQTGGNGSAWGYSQGSLSGTFIATSAASLPGTPFAGVTQFDLMGTGSVLRTGDFDGNGRADVWWHVNGSAGTILFNGAAGFASSAGSAFGFPNVAATTRLAAGDFNSDGITDLFYQTGANGTAWGYSQGNTNGTFTTTTTAGLPGTPFAGVTQFDFTGTGASLVKGDVSGDKDDDLWFHLNGDSGTLFIQGGSPPQLSSSTPADDATNVSTGTSITLTFDQAVVKGSSGFIFIKRTSNNSTVAAISVTSGSVTGSGTTWTVASVVALDNSTSHYVLIDSGAFVNSNGQYYAGISSPTVLNFTTAALPATITNVTSATANGSYKAGDSIAITVTFNQSVSVTGTPRLQLNSGASVFANYASGSPGNTLTFNYTIAAGQTSADLDYSSTGALTLNGGTINATSGGVAATLALPAPGAADSLGANKAIVIDTVSPAAPVFSAITTDTGISGSDQITSDATLVFSGTAEANSTVTIARTGMMGAIGSVTTTGAGAWSFDYTGTTLAAGNYSFRANATDAAGNVSSASSPFAVTIDTTAPAISISNPSSSITKNGPITYTVTYVDANFGSSTLAAGNITLNTTGTAAGTVTVSGTGATRTVTISSITGDGTLGISIAAGTGVDIAGNLAPAAGPSSLFTVDNTAPVITSATTDSGTYLVAYNYVITASGSPVSYNATGLPTNLVVNQTNGAITGVPNQTGPFTVTLSATDLAGNTGSATLLLTIATGNHNPVAGPDTIFRTSTLSVKVLVTALLSNDTDQDNDTLSLVSVASPTSNGGIVTRSGAYVYYQPAIGFTGADSFTYSLSDAHGGTATGTVTVAIKPESGILAAQIQPEPGGGVRLVFAGIPGLTYTIQYSPTLASPTWQTLGTATADSLGVYSFVDNPNPAPPMRFYRSIYP